MLTSNVTIPVSIACEVSIDGEVVRVDKVEWIVPGDDTVAVPVWTVGGKMSAICAVTPQEGRAARCVCFRVRVCVC